MVLMIDAQISGISGDMILSSLVSLGADKSKIIDGAHMAESYLENSKIKKINFESVKKNGKDATQLILEIDENVDQRKATDIKTCITRSAKDLGLSELASSFVTNTIDTLISAESKVHGESESSVHFHEAASIDTVIDILGTAIALDDLNLFDEEIICSPVAVGGGTVTFSHGLTSNPAYAILEIFKGTEIITYGGTVSEELTTPTGASILVNLIRTCSEFYPLMKINSVGYGAGSKDFVHFANVLKIVRGKTTTNLVKDSVQILETNVDDVSGEVLGNMIEKIVLSGAKDITITPGITKKGRPTQQISIICDSESMNSILELLVAETKTLGVRIRNSERFVVPRSIEHEIIEIDGHKFPVHYKIVNSSSHFKIEFDDIKLISNSLNKPVYQIEETIREKISKKNGYD
jgi:uncharacterized protein (TIGR00299 family) protein|tara:strand:- start:4224 stop:5447 length:1224 start_codon:yes stop_codon:yes gene_type:complete